MRKPRRVYRIVLLHAVLLPTLFFTFTLFTLAPQPWTGIDEAVVEKIAGEHGRPARAPLIDPGSDLLLFLFLGAGAVGGFAAGYWWRTLTTNRSGSGTGTR